MSDKKIFGVALRCEAPKFALIPSLTMAYVKNSITFFSNDPLVFGIGISRELIKPINTNSVSYNFGV